MTLARRSLCALAAAAALAHTTAVRAADLVEPEATGPRVARAALEVKVQRRVLRNGLVVLLAPDPAAGNAAVWMSFRAGALYEPPGRAGLAHLVEHVLFAGPTPETDYGGILERRRAQHVNAATGFDRMTFQVVVPAEELPAALWATRDRLDAIPPLIDDALVERNRRAVLEERAMRDVDRPYGLFGEQLFRELFADPHPLHHGVIGDPAELYRSTAADVRRFAAERLVPANAILTVAGAFDPAEVQARIEALFGDLPPGSPARVPALPPLNDARMVKRQEALGRCPRMTVAWRFRDLSIDEAAALELGAQLFTFLTDQAFDMRVGAELVQYDGEAAFFLDLTLPYDEPISAVHGDAEGFLRQLTHTTMPEELIQAGNLALDRFALEALDDVGARAELLTAAEHQYAGRHRLGEVLHRHWEIEPAAMRDTARRYLQGYAVEVHARPTRPRPPHPERS